MIYDVIIIGGGPAGLTASLYLLRAGKKTLLIEKSSFGGQMAVSPKIENYMGFEEIKGSVLADIMLGQVIEKGLEVEFAEVLELSGLEGQIKTIRTEYGEYKCYSVIIANGVKHRKLGVPGEEKFGGRGVYYCAVCDGAYYRGKNVALVGGGNTALQEALMLSDICASVTVIQNLPEFTGEAVVAQKVADRKNIKTYFNSVVVSLNGADALSGLVFKNTATGGERELFVSAVFVAIGLEPDNLLFETACRLDKYGYFDAGEDCVTQKSGVFVAGDCRAKRVRQIATAIGDGAASALAACRYLNGISV